MGSLYNRVRDWKPRVNIVSSLEPGGRSQRSKEPLFLLLPKGFNHLLKVKVHRITSTCSALPSRPVPVGLNAPLLMKTSTGAPPWVAWIREFQMLVVPTRYPSRVGSFILTTNI